MKKFRIDTDKDIVSTKIVKRHKKMVMAATATTIPIRIKEC